MAITTIGFDNADITEAGFSKLMRTVGDVGWRHGVNNGLNVSPAAGTRQATVSPGICIVPGARVDSTSDVTVSFAANNTGANRIDYVIVRVDWTNNATTIGVVTGNSATTPPALTQSEGNVWSMPLAKVTVRPGASTIAAGDVEICKPLRYVERKFSDTVTAKTLGYSAGPSTVASVSITDPGWPYRIEVIGSAKFAQANSGYGYLHAVVGGTIEQTGRSPKLSNAGDPPVHVHAVTDIRSGPVTVQLKIEPAFMGSGSDLVLVPGSNCQFTVLQRPA